ncbi:DUF6415 family natural product biosynthesis protein [Streptomyces fradiae]|uniref:DUF6415 family natural product biosynthesis protein n=1 Tax=Streptomyces fradiae TaxID=1906 RepID=UPI0029428703|nr:hypothetical protein [Streptomyces fradiae]WOI59628.1 hypothetical protein RYQ63_06745 [Streptomyces fradiae]
MATVIHDSTQRPSGTGTPDDSTLRRALVGLRRSWASERIGSQVYEDLETVLSPFERPSMDQICDIVERFRETATTLVEVVPHLVQPYPADTMLRLCGVSAEHPPARDAHGHARRLAVTILAVLDLAGDVR